MQKLTTLFSTAFLIMLLSIQGCKKDNGDDTPDDLALTTEKGSYYPLEIAQLNVFGGKIGNDTLQGEFNEQRITVYAFDSAIVFVVPDVAAGDYTLKVNASGKTIESPVNVKALTGVQPAETYLQKYTSEAAANVAYIKAKADSMTNVTEAATLRSDADKITAYMNGLNSQFQSLSMTEKEDFAKFMEANKSLLDELHQAVMQMQNDASIASRSGVEDHERNVENLMDSYAESVKATVKSIPKAAVALLVLKASAGGGIVGLVSATAAGIYIGIFVSDLLSTLAVMTKLIDMSFVPFQNFSVNGVNYTSNTKTKLIAELTYRSVFSTDVQNKINSVINKFTSAYETFRGGYEYVVNKMPAPLKPSSVIESLSNIGSYISKKRQVFSSYFSLKNISNPKVTVQEQKNADGSTDVTFSTTETTKQAFTYDLEYTNSKFANDVKTTISATVEPGFDSTAIYAAAVVGNWIVKSNHYNGSGDIVISEVAQLDVLAEGTGKYHSIVQNGDLQPGEFQITWSIQNRGYGYIFVDAGYWHPAILGEPYDRLSIPVTSFKTWTSNYLFPDTLFLSRNYIKQ